MKSVYNIRRFRDLMDKSAKAIEDCHWLSKQEKKIRIKRIKDATF